MKNKHGVSNVYCHILIHCEKDWKNCEGCANYDDYIMDGQCDCCGGCFEIILTNYKNQYLCNSCLELIKSRVQND